MTRIGGLLQAVLGASLLAFGLVADLSLVAQGESARAASSAAMDETARLVAASVRAAVGALEEAVLKGRADDVGVAVERLAIVPGPAAALGGRPYSGLARSELAGLLTSTGVTSNGLPEAVVARLALGEVGLVSSGDRGAAPDIAARLLAGELPVRPEDVAYLARALGAFDEARVRGLVQRLRAAPDAADTPVAPAFRRALRPNGALEGWTVDGRLTVRYEVGVVDLLGRAGVGGRARPVAGGGPRAGPGIVAVADIAGLDLAVSRDTSEEVRVRALRIALWAAVLTSAIGLLAVRRALARETRATAREKAFLAGVTHELRSPVASIRLLGETLAEGRGDAREYGALVARESERLEGLVERVLSVARVEAAPSFAPVEPRDILSAVVALMRPRAERRAVSLECSADSVPSATWDGEAVQGALVSLVENAIQHGREGGRVVLRAQADGAAVAMSVSDDGPGIARSERRSIFGRFARGRSEAKGTGLGLYLVEQVARAHGGRVDLDTDVGRGSTFTLVLPLEPPLPSGKTA